MKHIWLNIPRLKFWIGQGAKPSDAVCKLLSKFHLLPKPPMRRNMPFDAEIYNALNGRGCSKTLPDEEVFKRRREMEERIKSGENVEEKETVMPAESLADLYKPKPHIKLYEPIHPKKMNIHNLKKRFGELDISRIKVPKEWILPSQKTEELWTNLRNNLHKNQKYRNVEEFDWFSWHTYPKGKAFGHSDETANAQHNIDGEQKASA